MTGAELRFFDLVRPPKALFAHTGFPQTEAARTQHIFRSFNPNGQSCEKASMIAWR